MSESPKRTERDRIRNFDEIVEWCRSNGFTDFDFEGLERRVIELAKTMQRPAEPAGPVSAASASKGSSNKSIPFEKNSRQRDS